MSNGLAPVCGPVTGISRPSIKSLIARRRQTAGFKKPCPVRSEGARCKREFGKAVNIRNMAIPPLDRLATLDALPCHDGSGPDPICFVATATAARAERRELKVARYE